MSITRQAGYIPDLSRDMSTQKDGTLNFDLQNSLSSLFQALKSLVSNEGLQLPPLSPTSIANIQTFYQSFVGAQLPQNVPNIAGRMIYDYTNAVPKVFIMSIDPTTLFVLPTPSWKTFTIT